ncbi:hypothetical protein [Streptomyces albogriseolus]|uniref:hypothetical protein n=1 Tax=Streptomyces albogriseolus TaxID=1887 RepID=UPI003D70242C
MAAALLGCSSGGGSGAGDGPAVAAEDPAASGGEPAERLVSYTSRLPIAQYSYTEAENTAIESAQQVLTQRCMSSYGIAYEPTDPDREPADSTDRRYGVSSPLEAARFGYHPNPDALRDTQVDLPKEALPVFYGKRGASQGSGGDLVYKGKKVPDAGCFGQSIGKLSRYDDPDGAAVASRIATGSYQESLDAPAVKEVFRKWSSCMRKDGFRFASPNEPLNKSAFQGGEISAEERETAVADVRCKEATGLLDIWFKAESAIQRAHIQENVKALEGLRTAHREKAAVARRIVADG